MAGGTPLDVYLGRGPRPEHERAVAGGDSGEGPDADGVGTLAPDPALATERGDSGGLAQGSDGRDTACYPCAAGFHSECDLIWTDRDLFTRTGCCDGGRSALEASFDAVWGPIEALDADEGDGVPDRPAAYFDGFTGRKALTDYVDPISSGRKEAARKFPIEKGQKCEWAWLAAAGGGVAPITGCPGYPAEDIHHGPDKNTLRNVVGNVHRICTYCHNRWHGANDPHYGERPPADQPFVPVDGEWVEHDPVTKASDEEVFAEEMRRRNESRRHGNLD